MASDEFPKTMHLVASQLEAASTLLKYAADDLRDMAERPDAQMVADLQMIAQNLLAQAAVVDGNAAFCIRMGEDAALLGQDEDEGQAAFESEIAG